MATAVEYGLITALAAVVVISAVTTLHPDHYGDNAKNDIVNRANTAFSTKAITLGQSFQDCNNNLCLTGIVSKMPTSSECGTLDIVQSGSDMKGKRPLYSVDVAQTYRFACG